MERIRSPRGSSFAIFARIWSIIFNVHERRNQPPLFDIVHYIICKFSLLVRTVEQQYINAPLLSAIRNVNNVLSISWTHYAAQNYMEYMYIFLSFFG